MLDSRHQCSKNKEGQKFVSAAPKMVSFFYSWQLRKKHHFCFVFDRALVAQARNLFRCILQMLLFSPAELLKLYHCASTSHTVSTHFIRENQWLFNYVLLKKLRTRFKLWTQIVKSDNIL